MAVSRPGLWVVTEPGREKFDSLAAVNELRGRNEFTQ